jgi:AP-4 complex subunit epsilon-1
VCFLFLRVVNSFILYKVIEGLHKMGTEGHSKDFLQFVKAIGESRSKQEEDRILLSEIQTLKKCFTAPDLSAFQVKEYLVRAIYIEMLGYKAPFAYIHAIKLTQTRNLLCKKIGYLFCSLFLNSQHELLLLLINSLQKVSLSLKDILSYKVSGFTK